MFNRSLVLTLVLSFLSGKVWPDAASVISEILADPTRPIGYRSHEQKKQKLNLQAIFSGGGSKKAIVNGVIVKEGDTIEGKHIVSIRPGAVVYAYKGESLILKLRPSIFDKK